MIVVRSRRLAFEGQDNIKCIAGADGFVEPVEDFFIIPVVASDKATIEPLGVGERNDCVVDFLSVHISFFLTIQR